MEAARSALDKIKAKIAINSEEACSHNIGYITPNEPNFNRRELNTIAASLNNYNNDPEHAYVIDASDRSREGNIFTPKGKLASDRYLVYLSPRGNRNYTWCEFGNKARRNMIIQALEAKLGERTTPSPPCIDRVG